jgi:hypothetical protein
LVITQLKGNKAMTNESVAQNRYFTKKQNLQVSEKKFPLLTKKRDYLIEKIGFQTTKNNALHPPRGSMFIV